MKDMDTTTVDLSQPVSDAYTKALLQAYGGHTRLSGNWTEPYMAKRESADLHVAASTSHFERASLPRHGVPIRDLLYYFGAKARTLAAVTMIDLRRMSNDPYTERFDVDFVRHLWSDEKRLAVAISPRLRMPQEEVGNSSFLLSSGAALTWDELIRDSEDDAD